MKTGHSSSWVVAILLVARRYHIDLFELKATLAADGEEKIAYVQGTIDRAVLPVAITNNGIGARTLGMPFPLATPIVLAELGQPHPGLHGACDM